MAKLPAVEAVICCYHASTHVRWHVVGCTTVRQDAVSRLRGKCCPGETVDERHAPQPFSCAPELWLYGHADTDEPLTHLEEGRVLTIAIQARFALHTSVREGR